LNKKGHSVVNTTLAVVSYFVEADLIMSIGIFLAASAPDRLEVSYRDSSSSAHNGYSRLIKHRTITHWWPIWVSLCYYSLNISQFISGFFTVDATITGYLASIIYGYSLGALIHIATDSMSPMGVPILLPFGRYRKGIKLYTTGKSEWRILYPLVIISIMWIGAKNAPFITEVTTALSGFVDKIKDII